MFKPENLKYLRHHVRGRDVDEIQAAALFAHESGGDQGCFEWGCRRYLLPLSIEEKEWLEAWLFPVIKRAKRHEERAIAHALRELAKMKQKELNSGFTEQFWSTAGVLEDRLRMPRGKQSASEKWQEKMDRLNQRERQRREEFMNRFAYLLTRRRISA